MKYLRAYAPAILATLLAAAPAAAQDTWSIAILPGLSVGGRSDTELSLLGATYRQLNSVAALGLEAGVCGWDGGPQDFGREMNAAPYYYTSYTTNRSTLQHVSASLRLRIETGYPGSGPYALLSLGGYRQDLRDRYFGAIRSDPRYGAIRPGVALGFGASGRTGLKPGAELRMEWVATQPQPTVLFTTAMGLYANW